MLFDELGIYGWDSVEPLVLAAIVADLPVLLIGDIGTNKTEGAKTIAQAVLGAGTAFRHYEVPTLNFDDLVGFLNPKGLAKGMLEFVPTPLSIWKTEAALFDELNRANPFIQSKLHELIRTRHIMGLPTKLRGTRKRRCWRSSRATSLTSWPKGKRRSGSGGKHMRKRG
jgi:MoxR-like ATPase